VSHPRPRLNVFERYLACIRVLERHWSVSAAAQAAGVSRQTIHKWLRRYRADGVPGLADRSSRPWRMPGLTRIDLAVRICVERLARRWGPHLLGYLLGVARSTVYAVLRRAQLNRLDALHGRRAVVRYEWPAAGDMVHLDVKRLGHIEPGWGWRILGKRGNNTQRRRPGFEYCHVAVDDHSRWPEVAILGDETPGAAIAALEGAVASFARAGVRVRRVLTDNGNCYRSLDFAAACQRLGIRHLRTRPYTPRTNGKAERFIKTLQADWAYAQLYYSSDERTAALPAFLDGYRSRPNVALGGHTPMCRFLSVNDLSGNHT
jgi:transposase InsO family protein